MSEKKKVGAHVKRGRKNADRGSQSAEKGTALSLPESGAVRGVVLQGGRRSHVAGRVQSRCGSPRGGGRSFQTTGGQERTRR